VADLLSNPLLFWILGGVAAYVVYLKVIAPAYTSLVAPRLGRLSLDSILGAILGASYANARLERLISREKKAGNYLAVGKIYEDHGKPDKAVEAYVAGEEHWAAAATLERMGRLEKAAEAYLKAGDHKKAAQVFIEAKKTSRAAALFEEKGNNLEAARLYGLAGDWGKAGDLFVRSGYPERAAEAFEKQGAVLRAAECYEKHFMENVSYGTTYSSTAASPDQKSALRAGRLFEKAKDLQRALQIFGRGNYFEDAARVCEALGQPDQAAEFYLRAENPLKAAEAHDKAGDRVKAANLRGEVAFKANRVPEAAAYFQQGQDYLRAAELYESVGMLAEAAGAFEAAESYAAAGAVYIRAGMKDRAAAAFERGEDFETAARLYEEVGNAAKSAELFAKAGLTFKGGEAAAKAGEREKAIALLQRVTPADEDYRAATALLVRLFIEAGQPGLAVERLQKVLAGQHVASENLDLHYWLAVGLERSGHVGEATALYKKILAEDYQFRDVQARLTGLQTSPSAAPAPAVSPARPEPPAGPPASAGAAVKEISGRIGNKYEIVKPLGRGAMGMVYVARDTVLERDVALKVMVSGIAGDPDARQRFEREAKAVAKMTHRNVVTVHDLGYHEDGSPYIAMELLRGKDLQSAMRQPPSMDLDRKLDVVLQVLIGLGHAHQAGVIHRDIKPANIFLHEDGSVKIMDFGVARLAAGSMTETGHVVGTADYMSPEQVRGAKVDTRSDLFSVGCVLYELLAGQRPFQADSLMTIFYKITHNEPDWEKVKRQADQARLMPIVKKALSKDLAGRYQTAAEFAAALQQVLKERAAPAPARQELASANLDSSRQTPPARVTGPPPAQPRASAPAPAGATPRPQAAQPAAGQARFVPKEELGRGPLGVIYRAEDRKEGRGVALRVLPAELVKEGAARQALVADLRAAAQVVHPNLVRLFGVVEMGGKLCVVCEYVSGKDCAGPLKAGRRMGLAQVLNLARALGPALGAVHARGLVHGSVQPSNVLLVSGSVKLADLGLGRLARLRPDPGGYRAPENPLDAAGDLYALTTLLYHLYTGAPPVGQPAAPGQRIAGTPQAFDRFVLRGLNPRPELRFATAAELTAELGKLP